MREFEAHQTSPIFRDVGILHGVYPERRRRVQNDRVNARDGSPPLLIRRPEEEFFALFVGERADGDQDEVNQRAKPEDAETPFLLTRLKRISTKPTYFGRFL